MQRFLPVLSGLLLAWPAAMQAEVKPNSLFSDHTVLQRDIPLPVWGTAKDGEEVRVTFAGQTVSTVARDGRWTVRLQPIPASLEGQMLTISGENTVTIRDVLVGDVWLCSGQSNMAFQLNAADNAVAAAAAADLPLIRQFRVKTLSAPAPQSVLEGQWQVCNPGTAPTFSAVAFFFARELQPAAGVSIGLINSTVGGTSATAWMSAAALASDPVCAAVGERWAEAMRQYPAAKAKFDLDLAAWQQAEAQARADGTPFTRKKPGPPPGPGDRNTPTGLFNGMIAPLIPYPLKGILWYQGEQDASKFAGYKVWFPTMIKQWRRDFGQGDLPFLYVQLPNHNSEGANSLSWANMRGVQAEALALPATGMAVTIDVGENENVHPKRKEPVGHRLALLAEALVYGKKVVYQGPVFDNATTQGSAMIVHFKRGADGLMARGGEPRELQLAGEDHQFKTAQGVVEGATLRVTSPEVPVPVAVRYAWRNGSEANLFNGSDLPAAPFRSDDWDLSGKTAPGHAPAKP